MTRSKNTLSRRPQPRFLNRPAADLPFFRETINHRTPKIKSVWIKSLQDDNEKTETVRWESRDVDRGWFNHMNSQKQPATAGNLTVTGFTIKRRNYLLMHLCLRSRFLQNHVIKSNTEQNAQHSELFTSPAPLFTYYIIRIIRLWFNPPNLYVQCSSQ